MELISKDSIEEIVGYPIQKEDEARIYDIVGSFDKVIEMAKQDKMNSNEMLELEALLYLLRNKINERILTMDKIRLQKKLSTSEDLSDVTKN